MIKNSLLFALTFLIFVSCKNDNKVEVNNHQTKQLVSSVTTLNFKELKPYLEKKDDKIYIVNFWATWCGPCVKELPYFEKINKNYNKKNVEVILVSLDFPKQVEKKLIPFINKKQLNSRIFLLDDVNEDVWIKAIDSTWSGAIPATLIYNKNKRKFYEKSFDYTTLENELKTFLN